MAATAYAALRPLLTTVAMEQTQSPLHPPFPFPAALIDTLIGRVQFMVDFLEQGWKGAEHLESRITQLAYAAEDAIETPIVDRICGESTGSCRKNGSDEDYLNLQRITEELGCIMAEMKLLIKDNNSGIIDDVHRGGSRSCTSSSSTAPPQRGDPKMVGFQEDKSKIIDELTWNDHQSGMRIIPIVGMGGIGKTTLARNVFEDEHITRHFDVRAWVTVSEDYNIDHILKGVLSSIQNQAGAGNSREQVYKSLFNRRYFVVFDDMWNIDVWNEIKQCFPENNNRSRVMVTTRLTNLAAELSTGFKHAMKCLDEENSWNLFCEKVFIQKSCPLELQDIGRKIVRNCRGLPLAIVVIGGYLAKSNQTLRYWEHVLQEFHSFLYSSDDDHCSKILLLSYYHLPIHLKPCLLYFGVFPEDYWINVRELMSLWIAEGFLKPLVGKTLEEIAEEYLMDLTERNFITVIRNSFMGKVKYVMIHDLLRELCLREAQKEMFYCVVKVHNLEAPLSMHYLRRIVIWEFGADFLQNRHLSDFFPSHVRSLIWPVKNMCCPGSLCLETSAMKFLRILYYPRNFSLFFSPSETIGPWLVNLRFLNCRYEFLAIVPKLASLRNFQILHCDGFIGPIEMRNLVQLRHLKGLRIGKHDLEDGHNDIVLGNLQSLGTLEDFRFSEEAMRRIPNLQKLKVYYSWIDASYLDWCDYSAHNIERLKKLQSFSCEFGWLAPNREEFLQSLVLPHSLKKLSLSGCKLIWEDMTVLGSLPNLEVLKLYRNSFVGAEWNPVDGGFRRLKFLKMSSIDDLMIWNADGTHFPCLEKLVLCYCSKLKEIPLGIGEISTLRLIELRWGCSVSAVESAIRILEEQQSFGDDNLVVEVFTKYKHRSIHDVDIKNLVATSQESVYVKRKSSLGNNLL